MSDEELDQMLRKVMVDALEQESREDGPEFVPSLRHQHSMQAMLKQPLAWAKHREAPFGKKLLLSLGVGGILTLSPTVRADVTQWVSVWSQQTLTFHYGSDELKDLDTHYVISALPDQYVEDIDQRFETFGSFSAVYHPPENEMDSVTFDYDEMYRGMLIQFRLSDDDTYIPASVHDMEAWVFLAEWEEAYDTITWIDSANNLQFTLRKTNSSLEELIALAESVEPVD